MTAQEDLSRELRDYMIEALYAVHPRQRSSLHWVMNPEWYREVAKLRAIAGPLNIDVILGLPYEIKPDGGAPHLEAA